MNLASCSVSPAFHYLEMLDVLSPSTAGAIEKQKLVYILNRDAAARLTISSPLEAHKANTLVYHVVGVDVGFENPMFACLEMDYEVMAPCVCLSLSLPTRYSLSLLLSL